MKIVANAPLQTRNTLGLPAVADHFCEVATRDELTGALAFARQHTLAVAVLGGGSNTVVAQRIPGLVLLVANAGLTVLAEDETSVTVAVAAGENWHRLAMRCLDNGWYGLENLVLIPGRVGAAPIQNIGAYGVELSDFLVAVEVVEIATGETRTLSAAQCEPGYRDSIFKQALKGRVVIWSVILRLSKLPRVNLSYPELAAALADNEPTPRAVAEAVIALRQAKLPDPAQIHNAGSFFKNPVLPAQRAQKLLQAWPDIPHFPQPDNSVKFAAAWLIDRAHWKGVREGNVGVHSRQALVLVHYGKGTSEELLRFSSKIAEDIRVKFDVELEMEPVLLGASTGVESSSCCR